MPELLLGGGTSPGPESARRSRPWLGNGLRSPSPTPGRRACRLRPPREQLAVPQPCNREAPAPLLDSEGP